MAWEHRLGNLSFALLREVAMKPVKLWMALLACTLLEGMWWTRRCPIASGLP